MSEIAQIPCKENVPPPSTGKKKKARRVFGNVLTNGDANNNSLSYSPSPRKKQDTSDQSQSSSKVQDRLVTNLFSIEENATPSSQHNVEGRKSHVSSSSQHEGRKSYLSSSQQSISRSESSSAVIYKPFSNVIGDQNNSNSIEEENLGILVVPKSIRVPADKTSVESKLSLENFSGHSSLGQIADNKTRASGMKHNNVLVQFNDPSKKEGRSVNAALNAAKRAREKALREKAKAAAMIRGQWKEEKEEALEFYEESEKMRQEQLNLQIQLSSQFSKAKAQWNQQRRQVKREACEKEFVFKSNVAVEQRQKLKEIEDKRRRESIAVRAKIRANNRQGEEKLRLMKIEEMRAIQEERECASRAFQQYHKDRLASAKKNYQFRRGDAIRIRDLHNQMEAQRLQQQHDSFELMLAAERDADEYRRGLAEQRRQSLAGRNALAHEQRVQTEQELSKEKQAEHESHELKWQAERDVDNYKKKLEQERRESLEFRNKEGRKQRQLLSEQAAKEKELEHESFKLKFEAEKDVEAYNESEALRRRKSLEQRGFAMREFRQKQSEDESKQQAEEHESWELKFAGEKDVAEYHQQLEADRRKSLNKRNQEAKRQRDEHEKLRSQEQEAEHKSYELKWDGERDAKAYLESLQEERRQSLNNRNAEARVQRTRAEEQRGLELKKDHESYELTRAASKDVEEYQKKCQEERRESLANRNQEKVRHAKVMEELSNIAKDEQTESYLLKWAGENDVKEYMLELEEERRKSLQFRNEEGRRHREVDDEMRRQEIMRNHEDEELKAAGREDIENYRRECADRDRASLEFRGKELLLHRLEESNQLQREREIEEGNNDLEALARIDVQDYIKSCKNQRRKSLAFRAKEKRRHAEWVRLEEQRAQNQRSLDERLRARDSRTMELARQKQKREETIEALRHAGCSFSSFPPV